MLSFDIAMSLVICLLYTMCPFSVEGKLIIWLFLLLSVNCLFVCLFVCLPCQYVWKDVSTASQR